MFALLALGGDVGCSVGPLLVGTVSDALGGTLKWGILSAVIFPVAMVLGVLMLMAALNGRGKKSGSGDDAAVSMIEIE